MKDVLYLAWRYLAHHRIKTTILVASIALIVFLPVGLNVLVGQSADQLTARAEATPLLIGARGSPLELVLNSLYFETDVPDSIAWTEVASIAASGLAEAIPIDARFRVRTHPIVGTSLEYFDFRGLQLAEGRRMAVLGECVLGAAAAAELGVGVGDAVVSSPESVFDLAGVYPLRMRVVGVFAASYTPDDWAVFVDVKTSWIIQGLGHGHQDLTAKESASGVLKREGDLITANASVVQYNEITAENADSFHFHGDLGEYPLTGVIAVPGDEKSGVLLMGRYEEADATAQILRPSAVMAELLDTIFTVKAYVVAAVAFAGAATLATTALVFLLSLRLREREIETMVKIGGSPARVIAILGSEIAVVLVLAVALAGVLTALASRFGASAVRLWIAS
jgi:putative ABC transport system permease protein